MKQLIDALLKQTLDPLIANGQLPVTSYQIQLDTTKDKAHGDLATNVALTLARQAKMHPKAIAQLIIDHLPTSPWVTRAEIAGPGFINFFLSLQARYSILHDILKDKDTYGHENIGQGKKVLVEFLSCNPTCLLYTSPSPRD